jgi:uncharacterized membrane protein (UPF0182 family)
VDGDPYPFVDQATGHIMWMLDGYTTMANYPYSERQSLSALTGTSLRQGQKDTQINYIRNSVKATVDAYNGTVTLYAWDPNDPVLKAWMNIFPGLVKPAADMPDSIRSHVRYPQDMFDVQRGLLAQYHISNPVDAYNGKGKWAVPQDPFFNGSNQPPYYVLARPPGTDSNSPEFQLTTPMVVNGATNLAAYISADCDPGPNYGQLTVLQVTGQQTIYGPSQVANDLKSTAVISKDITQLDQGQSAVRHGNLLTLPVGNSFLYVEPLYVQSAGTGASFPTLQRVLVRYGNGNRIGYSDTLDNALKELRDQLKPGTLLTQSGGIGSTSGPTTTPPQPPSGPSGSNSTTTTPTSKTVQQLIRELATAQTNLNNAYDTHDPTRIADAQAAVNAIVEQLVAAGQSQAPHSPAPPSPTP